MSSVAEQVSGDGSIGSAISRESRPRATSTAHYQRLADNDRGTGGERLANFPGLSSVGLGLAQVLAPGGVARACGIDPHDERNRTVMRLLGMRELTSGISILSKQQPTKAMWSRVAGDTLDLALLGKALANRDNNRS